MALQVFGDAWAEAWCAAVNASGPYRRAAATFEGSLALVMAPQPVDAAPRGRAVFVDLARGTCRAARAATPADLDTAAFVISGTASVWKSLLDREIEPIPALMRGQLKLDRGSLATLVRYIVAARELVAAATRVETDFPDDWLGGA